MATMMINILLALCFYQGLVEAARPIFVDNMNLLYIEEDEVIGKSVYTLYARDPAGGKVTYGIVADMFKVDENTGDVTLTRLLDYEAGEIALNIRVIARDANQLETSQEVSVNVVDANDNDAVFTENHYDIRVAETTPINSVIFPNLTVTDKDYVNSDLTVRCDTSLVDVVYKDSCNIFLLKRLSYSRRLWRGNLVLNQSLDYETRPTYQISLITFDGRNRHTQSLEIQVVDVNDAPPYFIRQVPAVVSEDTPVGSVVNYVIAVDGDRTNKRPIRYRLTCTDGKYFAVDYVSGNITNIAVLNRENPDLAQGYVDLCIRASELINQATGEIGNTSDTTADATIRISILDVNDNAPKFKENNYEVSIYENIPNESALPDLIMTVTDEDTGTANFYKFVLLNHTDIFAIFPDSGQAQTTASIKVINTTKIDYELGPRQYFLDVLAVETQTVNPKTGSVRVTVNILDVNDNLPIFDPPNYIRTIPENAVGGRLVVTVTATDADNNQVSDIVFSLVGNGADKFAIESRTGAITVKSCSTPGVRPCIDYEDRKQYQLTVMARDENGQGRESTGSLTVNIENINDNRPQFRLPSYLRYINEGEILTIDPLVVSITDADNKDGDTVGAPTTFAILGTTLWRIDSRTGNITAVAPIKYEDSAKGYFNFTVSASNSGSRPNTNIVPVYIIVIDKNNFSPTFVPADYTEFIDEDIAFNSPVILITATDKDSPTSENGRFEYTIVSGSQGKFEIDRNTGQVSTSSVATFDYDVQRQYLLTILARDGGKPQRTGTATVTVIVRDKNNRLPYFIPTTQRFEVNENVALDTVVYTVKATDPDVSAVLRFKFEGPKSAITPQGTDVDINSYNFGDLFTMEPTTGRIKTARRLDRDRSSVITYQMIVEDTASPGQSGTGTVIITVLEYNVNPPYFEQAVYFLTIDEERPIGTFVTTLVAMDDDNTIDRYEMISNPNNYFTISPSTGVISINGRLDYEQMNSTKFIVQAYDTGVPQLSGSTTVSVRIRNINDNSPRFINDTYTKEVREQKGPSAVLLQVSANDIDLEDFGVVRYRLDSRKTQFEIQNVTGEIKLRAGQELDREREAIVAVQVTAYDSPNTPEVRREFTIPVYFIILDANDNEPKFSRAVYSATIIETIVVGAEVVPLIASDLDFGENANLAFFKTQSILDPNDYFAVGRQSGKVTVDKPLVGRSGDYTFEVEVRDKDGVPNYLTAKATVVITVLPATNSPPRWVFPPYENMTIDVLESQYYGMFIYDCHAEDDDDGPSGVIDYGFMHGGVFTNQTKEFHINRVTGVIRAEIVYDREQVDRYFLQIIARDNDVNPQSTSRFVTVRILDVDDNAPTFPMSNGVVIPYDFEVNEDSPAGTLIGRVTAIDRDLPQYSKIYYVILAGNEKDQFRINTTSGEIRLNRPIDREDQATYTLFINATNNVNDYSVIRNRRKRSTSPSMTTVRINVRDRNDVEPRFIYPAGATKYHGCVSVNAPYGQSILQVSATDDDSGGPAGIRFNIMSGNDDNMFTINSKTGMISNRNFLSSNTKRVYDLTVNANDTSLVDKAEAYIFVTTDDNEEKLVILQPESEVRRSVPQLIRTLSMNSTGIKYICVTNIRDHVMDDGKISDTSTDVYVTGISEGRAADDSPIFTILPASDLNARLTKAQAENKRDFDALYIDSMGGTGKSDSFLAFFDRTPVLVVLIIVILLIIMAIILFCLACFCIHDSKQKKIRKYQSEHIVGAPIQPVAQPVDVGKSVNPMYDNPVFVPAPAAPTAAPMVLDDDDDDDDDPAVFTPQPVEPQEYATVQRPVHTTPPNEPETEEPVIVTTIEPDDDLPEPSYRPPTPVTEEPEPVIETVVDDEPDHDYIHDLPPPQEEEEEIDTVIIADSPELNRRHTTPSIKEEDEPRTSL
ncbi:cadherin-87A [Patella vulgata]|uniref:cadherin-87A n=1 Tax=Patella vulgata TaxID=6465 RepID=UPI0021803A82|nr:cadherin-87A [Patella vulgata]